MNHFAFFGYFEKSKSRDVIKWERKVVKTSVFEAINVLPSLPTSDVTKDLTINQKHETNGKYTETQWLNSITNSNKADNQINDSYHRHIIFTI